jgi:DNA-binding NarL/FixJ family response regulator
MYSMVILDDEKIVLQGIQKLCQKEDFGFVIKGAFVDSLKALDALPGLRPHLIITDVRMPQMDGLEFARRAKEILPESEIVILSGYRDFSYAQTAMQIGVSDYLLKPIKKTDFGDMLHRMYERLEAKIGQAAYYQVLDGYARGLVGEEEVKHAVSSVQPANVAQRPGVLAKEGEQSPTKIVRDALYYIRRHYMVDINHTLTPGLCISSDTNYPDEAAQLCLEFAKRVNERNVTQYDYVDFVNDSGLEAPSEEALAVRQFHEQLDQAVHYTPLWYAVLEKEDGDNWRNLTRKLLGGAVNQEEFVQDAAQYLNFTAQ